MENLQTHIANYLNYCYEQKRLDEKTLKAYRIDLHQFFYDFFPSRAYVKRQATSFFCRFEPLYFQSPIPLTYKSI